MINDSSVYLFFRRMRVPLIVLISSYAVATAGFTLMPGQDDQGNPWRLSLFEAFYVVSYTGSTIGFGEVPYAFSPAQRLWTTFSIYLTVIAWLFSIGSIVSLLQDSNFRTVLRRTRFQRAVRSLRQPFYLICGHGDTGRALARALSTDGHPVVVLDNNPDKIDQLIVSDYGDDIAPFCMDARLPDNLIEAGLRSRWCLGLFAVTGCDQTNLKIAISARLLNQNCVVQARADTRAVADNLRSFDTHGVINPIEEYVRRLRLAVTRPAIFALYQWIASGPHMHRPEPVDLPQGRWLVCGYGRLGQALAGLLQELGIETVVIADPRAREEGDLPELPAGAVAGPPTQAETLREAGIESAVALLATTREDADNLSILITARALNDQLFTGLLENGLSSHELMREAKPDLLAQPSVVVAGAMLNRARSALSSVFFEHLLQQSDELGLDLLERLSSQSPDRPPELLTLRISERRAPALAAFLESGQHISLGELLRDAQRFPESLPITPLLLRRGEDDRMLPDSDCRIELGDQLLLAAAPGSPRRLERNLSSESQLAFVITGRDQPQGWLWQRLS